MVSLENALIYSIDEMGSKQSIYIFRESEDEWTLGSSQDVTRTSQLLILSYPTPVLYVNKPSSKTFYIKF